MHTSLDIEKLITDSSGVAGDGVSRRAKHIRLAAKLTEIGSPITAQGIQKWRDEENVPGSRIVDLAVIARSESRSLDITDYLIN